MIIAKLRITIHTDESQVVADMRFFDVSAPGEMERMEVDTIDSRLAVLRDLRGSLSA